MLLMNAYYVAGILINLKDIIKYLYKLNWV